MSVENANWGAPKIHSEQGRRKILHCNVTAHPTSEWIVQQLPETFPKADPYRYAMFDHDTKSMSM